VRFWRLVVACLLLANTDGEAEGPAQEVERLAKEARVAYRSAEYDRAMALLEQAYRIRQVAALLYNAAKVYEKKGLLDKAREHYHRYLEASDSDPQLRMKVAARLATLERGQGVGSPLGAIHPSADGAGHSASPRSVQEEALLTANKLAKGEVRPPLRTIRNVQQNHFQRHERDRFIASALVGTGLAVAGVGVGLSVSAYLERQFVSRSDETKQREFGSYVAYGLAAASIGCGGYFFARRVRSDAPRRQIVLVPSASWKAVGLQAAGLF
jgi:tetratricopeptide (TPR) repeat protein